jgi:hypothetical protein
MNERFATERAHRTGGPISAFELNIGVQPRPEYFVPFGCPGYAFIDEKLRKQRGAPKYLRAEPVLMVGYQHMYSNVFKCLTQHGSIIEVEKVHWDTSAPLGVFLPIRAEDMVEEGDVKRVKFDRKLFKDERKRAKAEKLDKWAQKELLKQSSQKAINKLNSKIESLCEHNTVLRLNHSRVYKADGNPRPKPYILQRLIALDGKTVKQALKMKFVNSQGKMKSYRKADLDYDVYDCRWLTKEAPNKEGEACFSADFDSVLNKALGKYAGQVEY